MGVVGEEEKKRYHLKTQGFPVRAVIHTNACQRRYVSLGVRADNVPQGSSTKKAVS